jgi:hypothetical protein
MSRRYVIPTLLFTFVILVAVPALAQDGVQSIGACTIIDKPGSYVLARDITATLRDLKQAPVDRFTVGPACIVIVADFGTLLRDRRLGTVETPAFSSPPTPEATYPRQRISETEVLQALRRGSPSRAQATWLSRCAWPETNMASRSEATGSKSKR